MKYRLSKLILKIYKKFFWCEACVVYARPKVAYNKQDNWFNNDCPFCKKKDTIREYENFIIIYNDFPYPNTTEHLLLIPKNHYQAIRDFPNKHKKERATLCDKYLWEWYLMLNREFWKHPQSSIQHFHTHFIKEKLL